MALLKPVEEPVGTHGNSGDAMSSLRSKFALSTEIS
eukprot:CAMPEP_0185574782 /NCGR_PEP_ID=MMETSP0434-20130131/6152_1 /TAXON_ID=626734 ORGANISM="Favella taraikaensis, Strain Fe Narragansett Bay" /NCGR_SAMPLE_ID=MMETSP0434 /ASSEMBLY_ACC=CAM_ASM_000379 /LENGTH=35 /DNA_ID= /DNA_START= /DNA_END= /DNA_ORIENTATION=